MGASSIFGASGRPSAADDVTDQLAPAVLSDAEFTLFQRMMYELAGISLADSKKPLVAGRLAKRLRHYGMATYGEYYKHLSQPRNRAEFQVAVDLLTTNETYFFREPKHFDQLRQWLQCWKDERGMRREKTFRVWSGACSSGEEAYSIAMVLDDVLGTAPWELLASDLSTRVLESARRGLYPMERVRDMPPHYLTRYCLKGVGRQEGSILIDEPLRRRVRFEQINLNAALPTLGEFDVIFLRNVMIYFDMDTKRKVVARLIGKLAAGGYFLVSHSESLNGVTDDLRLVTPSVYRKP